MLPLLLGSKHSDFVAFFLPSDHFAPEPNELFILGIIGLGAVISLTAAQLLGSTKPTKTYKSQQESYVSDLIDTRRIKYSVVVFFQILTNASNLAHLKSATAWICGFFSALLDACTMGVCQRMTILLSLSICTLVSFVINFYHQYDKLNCKYIYLMLSNAIDMSIEKEREIRFSRLFEDIFEIRLKDNQMVLLARVFVSLKLLLAFDKRTIQSNQ